MESEQQTSSATDQPGTRPAAPEGGDPHEQTAAPAETAPSGEAPPAEPEVLAPDVERLLPCDGAARHIVDPDGPGRPSPVFLAVVSIVTLASDIGSKLWAEHRLESEPGGITLIPNHLAFMLAKNRGGAWGLLQGTNENVRRPFFLLVSAAAIAFIVTLYRKLQPRQRALKWGLPLVLGGALGNVFDRIRYGHVIDFIDYKAEWLRKINELVAKHVPDHVVTDHWPTFNVADIAICVGVGLMAVDMFTAKKHRPPRRFEAEPPLVGTLPSEEKKDDAPVAAPEPPAPAATAEPTKPE